MCPAASITQHVSGQMSKKLPQQGATTRTGVKLLHCDSVLLTLPGAHVSHPAFNSLWLITSSSFSPWDSTCLSIEQHVFCEATWEHSHWALGPPLGSFERGKKNGPKEACDGGRSNRSKASREPNAISFCGKLGTYSSRHAEAGQRGPEWVKGLMCLCIPSYHLFPCLNERNNHLRSQRSKSTLDQWKGIIPVLYLECTLASPVSLVRDL